MVRIHFNRFDDIASSIEMHGLLLLQASGIVCALRCSVLVAVQCRDIECSALAPCSPVD